MSIVYSNFVAGSIAGIGFTSGRDTPAIRRHCAIGNDPRLSTGLCHVQGLPQEPTMARGAEVKSKVTIDLVLDFIRRLSLKLLNCALDFRGVVFLHVLLGELQLPGGGKGVDLHNEMI